MTIINPLAQFQSDSYLSIENFWLNNHLPMRFVGDSAGIEIRLAVSPKYEITLPRLPNANPGDSGPQMTFGPGPLYQIEYPRRSSPRGGLMMPVGAFFEGPLTSVRIDRAVRLSGPVVSTAKTKSRFAMNSWTPDSDSSYSAIPHSESDLPLGFDLNAAVKIQIPNSELANYDSEDSTWRAGMRLLILLNQFTNFANGDFIRLELSNRAFTSSRFGSRRQIYHLWFRWFRTA